MAAKTDNGNDLNLIGAGTILEGKVKTPGSIRIEGRIIGEVVASQNISLGNTADVDGTVTARNITIGGKLRGNIIAQEKLVLESKAVVRGDIKAAKLVIDEGASFDGKCVMAEGKQMASVVELKPESRRAEER